jgi:molybdenum-dependent DNA-binding transcriptional regulator ModE
VNRFVKQNLLLITVMGISGVVILALLVYSAIVYFQMSQCISETESLREQIRKLINQRPAPVEGNKPLLQKDIDLYTKLNTELSSAIGNPYKKAGERFIEVLKEVKKDGSIEEARKEFIEEYNNTVGKDENPARQGMALDEMRAKYSKTWKQALSEFKKLVAPITQEPELDRNVESVAFAAIGIPRKMQNNPEKVMDYCSKYQEKIRQIMGQRMRPEADSLGFSFIENPAQTFSMEGEEGAQTKAAFRIEDIPLITRHWDIIGDICKRISTVEVKTLNFFHIRGINKENGAYDATFVGQGNYVIAHYSFEVTAPLAELRKLAESFCYDPVSKRFYILRSVFVFASDVEIASAKQLLNPLAAQQENVQKENSASPVRRGRRRGAVAEAEPAGETVDKEKELRAKWQEEFEKREKSLPFYQRSGYGDIKLAGANEYRAVFDVEYVELAGMN